MAKSKLKSCPFCGAKTIYGDEAIATELGQGLWVVVCGYCYCQSPLGTDEKSAIAAWNRRAKEGKRSPANARGVTAMVAAQSLFCGTASEAGRLSRVESAAGLGKSRERGCSIRRWRGSRGTAERRRPPKRQRATARGLPVAWGNK